jgi:hypothetical protein
VNTISNDKVKALGQVSPSDVEKLFADREQELHLKVDATRDAYSGFIFPINRADFTAVSQILDISDETARVLYKKGKAFSTFKPSGSAMAHITNHIFGASILALRGKNLDTGLSSVSDANIAEIVLKNEGIVLEIAEARVSWFGRIFFPAAAFSNAIAVFGGIVTQDAMYDLASRYRYAAVAGKRKTVRGDFGIGVWLSLLGLAA